MSDDHNHLTKEEAYAAARTKPGVVFIYPDNLSDEMRFVTYHSGKPSPAGHGWLGGIEKSSRGYIYDAPFRGIGRRIYDTGSQPE